MTSVQENKNELEAAVRYCESAISRAKATIESMEFRQQAATKAWHEQTGREESLTKKLAFMTEEYDRMKGYADRLLDEQGTMESELEERISEVADLKVQLVEERDRSMGYTKEIAELKSELDELSKAYKDSTREEITMKQAWCEQREIVALRDDQIAMLERRLAKKDNPYPFKEGDIYYVLNQLDGTWVESVWDDESESMHDSPDVPSHPHKVYFTVDQKNVLGKFKFEYD
jgi:predicted RNase H-like nuclease (RuvC/YqgF family)